MNEPQVLHFKHKLQKANRHGLVVDIDETLAHTREYWVKNMQSLFGNPEKLSSEEMIKKYRYASNVPYWQTKEAEAWKIDAVYSDSLQEVLPLIENANHFVEQINKITPIVGYLTTRPQSVLSGTKKWLKKHNFPDLDIIARPAEIEWKDGNRWKANVLTALYPQVIGIVDDNPQMVEALPVDYPGTVYFYDSEESLRGDIKVYPCKTWADVHAKVKLLHGVRIKI